MARLSAKELSKLPHSAERRIGRQKNVSNQNNKDLDADGILIS
jgi:7,8-dihydro-6-hydroxymethylpterin-pyrophosphokinase